MTSIKKIIPVLIAVIIIYAIFLLLVDLDKITDKIINFKLEFIPIIVSLVILSWLIVYFRWHLLLKNLEITIPHKINFQIFMIGGALGITPGKIGELFKSQILKDKFNISRTKTVPLFIIEKFFDITGALIVTSFGIWFIPELGYLSIFGFILLFILFKILISKRLFDKTLIFFERFNFIKKYLEPLSSSHEILTKSLQNKNLLVFSSLSISYWIVIGLAAFFVIQGFGISFVSILNIISTYSSSLIAGALSFIPGGIGIAEGSLIGLLSAQNIELSEAVVVVVLIRLFTLWFSTIVGFIALKTSKTL